VIAGALKLKSPGFGAPWVRDPVSTAEQPKQPERVGSVSAPLGVCSRLFLALFGIRSAFLELALSHTLLSFLSRV
jgi:hypothetical protein